MRDTTLEQGIAALRSELTDSQRAAAEPFLDVIATAGAGTGKTRLLAARFLMTAISLYEKSENAESSEKISKIAAMTFSEKAAAEMWNRICETAFALYWMTKDKNYFELYRSLRDANISTIHSFCYKLLSKMPLCAGLEPNFDVQPEEIIPQDFIIDFMSEIAEEDLEMRKELLRLIFRYSRWRVQNILCEMFQKRQMVAYAVQECATMSQDELTRGWNEILRTRWDEFRYAVQQNIDAISANSDTGKAGYKWRWIAENIPQHKDLPDTQFLVEMKEMLKSLGLAKIDDRLDNFRNFIKDTALGAEALDEFAIDVISFAKIYLAFEDYIWLALDRSKVLDYNELLLRAKDVIENMSPSERKALLPSYILLDEFQDTSPLQWEIFKHLLPTLQKILLVGDEKQSIYRFRGADVSVVRKGEELVSQRGGKKVPMNENFRTGARLLNLLNAIFEKVFPQESDIPYEARFQKLEPATSGEDNSSLYLIMPEENFEQSDTIVRFILAALDGQYLVGDGEPIRPGDFMVLTKSRKLAFEIIRELRGKNVPAIPLAETGFFDAPEIAVILHFISFIADWRRNGALYALLRSPIFDIGDDEILKIRRAYKEKYLWQCMEKTAASDSDENDDIVSAFEMLKKYLDVADFAHPDELLDEFLNSNGVLSALCAYLPEVATANVKKLMAHIRMLSAQAGMTFGEIQRTLAAEKEQNQTGYAIPVETKDVVRVSTIHSAKGLEAKIVIVADPGKRGGGRNKNGFYWEPSIPGQIIPKPANKNFSTLIHSVASALDLDRDRAEYERLFYVSLTRAKRHLIVVGKSGKNGKIEKNSFARRIIDGIGGDGAKMIIPEQLPDGFYMISPSEIEAPPKWQKSTEEHRPKIDLTSMTIAPKRLFKISAGNAAKFVVCQKLFYKDYLENAEETIPDKVFHSADESELSKNSLEFGKIAHILLSAAPFPSVKSAVELAKKLSDNERFLKVAESFAKSEQNRQLAQNIPMQEIPLYLRTGELIVNGIADVLLKNPAEVWDYKTGRQSKFHRALYSAQINIYRLAYAKFLGKEPTEIIGKIIWIGRDNIIEEAVKWDDTLENKLAQLPKYLADGDEKNFAKILDDEICAECGKCVSK